MNISRFPPRPIVVIAVLAVLAHFSLAPVVAQDENYANVFHNYLRGLAYASGGSVLWHEGTIYTSTETYSIGSRCHFKSLLQCSVEFTEIVTDLASYLAEIERYRPTEFAQAIIDGARSVELVQQMYSLLEAMDLEQDFAINANVLHHPKSGFWLDEENMFMAVVLSIREGGDINATATRMGSIISEVVTSLALEESRLPADS